MLSDIEFEQLSNELGLQNTTTDLLVDEPLPVIHESELTALMRNRSARDNMSLSFLSAGRYRHYFPSLIRLKKQQPGLSSELALEPEKSNSQRLKQSIESQLVTLSGMQYCSVYGLDLVSLLATLLSHSASMAMPGDQEQRSKVLIPSTISPAVRNALRTRLKYGNIDLVVLDYDKNSGCVTLEQLQAYESETVLALVLAWPNYFGQLEDFSELAGWARSKDSLVIGITDPLSLSYIKSPFQLTQGKMDYLIGDLQPLGLAVSQQGSTPTFLASSEVLSFDISDLSLLVRNELPVMQSYLSLLTTAGMQQSVKQANESLSLLVEKLSGIAGVIVRFPRPSVNECVIQIAQLDSQKAFKILAGHNMVLGYLLENEYPELSNCILVSCTNQHTRADVDRLVTKVATVVKNLSTAGCPVKPKF